MVTVETLLLVQADRAQCGADGSLSRSEDGACHEYLNVLPDAAREQWREGAKARIIVAGRVRTRSPLLADCGDERTLPFSFTNG